MLGPDKVLLYSERSTTGTSCWWSGFSWRLSDVDVDNVFDVVDIAFIPLFDLITLVVVVVVEWNVFDVRLGEGACA